MKVWKGVNGRKDSEKGNSIQHCKELLLICYCASDIREECRKCYASCEQ